MEGPLLTARLRMRPFAPADADAIHAIYSDPAVGPWIGRPQMTPAEADDVVTRATAHQQAHGFAMWAVEERASGVLVGEVGLQLLELKGPEHEIGWVIGRPWWGLGYATEASRAWLEAGFGRLGFGEVLAAVLPDNERSHHVARKLGMTLAGRRHVYGREHDIYVARPSR
jgi:RimJ/RimL family protein N-acetyltransferase